MKKLILATAAVLALGIAGTVAGVGQAQTTSPSTTPPGSATQSPGTTMPQQPQNETTPGAQSPNQGTIGTTSNGPVPTDSSGNAGAVGQPAAPASKHAAPSSR